MASWAWDLIPAGGVAKGARWPAAGICCSPNKSAATSVIGIIPPETWRLWWRRTSAFHLRVKLRWTTVALAEVVAKATADRRSLGGGWSVLPAGRELFTLTSSF